MHAFNQTHTARYLDITRSALIYRMQKYGLAPASTEASNEATAGVSATTSTGGDAA